jgi:hypothetical protein
MNRIAAMGLAILSLNACGASDLAAKPDPVGCKSSEFTVGQSPGGVELADLNKDGSLDLVVTNEGAGTISILLNDGGGKLREAPGSPFSVGEQPNDVAIADLDGDGLLDLAVANHEAHSVAIFAGDGHGAFRPFRASPIHVNVTPHPHGIAAADLNGDGSIDLAVDSWGTDQLELLYGDGRGNFRTPGAMIGVGRHPYQRHRAVDINKDGRPDLLTSNLDGHDLTVLLGTAAGFAASPGSPFPAGDAPFGLAVGDVNGDGNQDVGVVNAPSISLEAGRDGLTLLLGDGTGRFRKSAGSPLDTGAAPNRIAAGDIDGDGRDEVAVSRPTGNAVALFSFDSKGAMKLRRLIIVPEGPKGVAIGDLDGDGRKDLAITQTQRGRVRILFACPRAAVR